MRSVRTCRAASRLDPQLAEQRDLPPPGTGFGSMRGYGRTRAIAPPHAVSATGRACAYKGDVAAGCGRARAGDGSTRGSAGENRAVESSVDAGETGAAVDCKRQRST